MQGKKSIAVEELSADPEERLALRAFREELRAVEHTLRQLYEGVVHLQGGRADRHPLGVASASLWVAAKDTAVALAMLREQAGRWEREEVTAVVRWPPVDRSRRS